MSTQPQEIGRGKNLAARPLEVEFAVVLSRVIESIEDDPAPLLRNAVYELARIKLRREAWQKNPAINLSPSLRPCPLALADRDRRAELQPRDLTAWFFGDPLSGMSALDRRRRNERAH